MTSIKGVGRRFSNICLKKADIDMNKRAGELSDEEVERLITIMQNPRQYKIPDYFLNRKKDIKDGKYSQVSINKYNILNNIIIIYLTLRGKEVIFKLIVVFA